MRLLVTGASGFLGRYLVEAAVQSGHDVVAVVRPASAGRTRWPTAGVHEAVFDLRRPTPVGVFDGVDAVVHAAAQKSGDQDEQWASTVVATENLLAAMDAADVRRLVHVSTFSVYDYDQLRVGSVLDEDSPLAEMTADRDDYAKTKLWQEHLVRRFAAEQGGKLTVVRPGAVYGPGDVVGPTVGVELGSRFFVVGPDATLPLTYVEGCAAAIIAAAEREAAVGATVNVVDDDLPTRREFLAAASVHGLLDGTTTTMPWWAAIGVARTAALTNRMAFGGRARLPGILVPSRVRARFLPLQFPNGRARHVLGWSPPFDLDAALGRIATDRGRSAPVAA